MKTLAFVLLVALGASAQDAAPTGGRPSPHHVVTQTRTLTVFGELERKMATAIQKKEKDTLTAMATEDCEIRSSDAPAEPQPCAEWVANELPNFELKDFRITKMAVHLYDDKTAVVSFKYAETATANGREISGDWFLVDVWTKHEDEWKFTVRYMSLVPKANAPADGKPSGKN